MILIFLQSLLNIYHIKTQSNEDEDNSNEDEYKLNYIK